MNSNGYISQFNKQGLLKPAKRIYISLFDSICLIVISFLLMLVGMKITNNIPSFALNNSLINEKRVEMLKLNEESGLYEFKGEGDERFDSSNQISEEETFTKYCLSHILLSYTIDSAPFTGYTINVDSLLKQYDIEIASYSTDYLAKFYTVYVPKYNIYNDKNNDVVELGSVSEKSFFIKKLNDSMKNTPEYVSWIFNGEDFPYLKGEYAVNLYRYLFNMENSYQVGLTSYNFLADNYQTVHKVSSNYIYNSQRYQDLYTSYKSSYAFCSYSIDVVSLIVYFISFLLIIVLPQIIFKNGRTFGSLIFKGAVIDKDGLDLSWYQTLTRCIIQFFTFYGVMLFSLFMSGGLYNGWMFPIFYINDIGISLFHFTCLGLFIGIIQVILVFLTNKKTSLTELISGTNVVDLTYFKETMIEEEQKQEAINNETDSLKNIKIDEPFLDSSTFDNKDKIIK